MVHAELQKCDPDLNTCGTLEEDMGRHKLVPERNMFPSLLKISIVSGEDFTLGQFHEIITGSLKNIILEEAVRSEPKTSQKQHDTQQIRSIKCIASDS